MSTVHEDYGIREVTAHVPTQLSKIEVSVKVTSAELIGIEVEVENFQQRDSNKNIFRCWDLTNDGSLRNNGIEAVSKPMAASYAPAALQYLFNDYMHDACCFSPRTSVHIHLNVQDLTRAQVMDLILIYTIYEKLFYKFAGRGRSKNVYCVPLSESQLLTNLVDFGETRDGNWSKYTGLNTLPVSTYGTIEFRHMHGTTDVSKLAVWINLICKLKEYVRRTSTRQIRQMIGEMNDGFDFGALMHDIFGEYTEAFKYEGPQELNYMSAKQALAPRTNVRALQTNMSNSSAFFTFKGN